MNTPSDTSDPQQNPTNSKKNLHLSAAKTAKKDEFYTLLADVERELVHYVNDENHGGTPAGNQFRGKVVYCNCDDPEWSAFYQYFLMRFKSLGLAGLVTTHYALNDTTYKIEIRSPEDAAAAYKHFTEKTRPTNFITALGGNGDFRDPECIELLKSVDVVVTNPPFSLFREYLAQLIKYEKKFLVIGNQNAAITKELFPLVHGGKVWLGTTAPKEFRVGDWSETAPTKKFGDIRWYTNLAVDRRAVPITSYQTLAEGKKKGLFPKYDNYDALEVGKLADIPSDYKGVIGVPITFLDRWVPGCGWELVWQGSGNTRASAPEDVLKELGYLKNKKDRGGCGVVAGTRKFSRLFIRRLSTTTKIDRAAE